MREGRFISLLFLHGKPTSRVIAASIELTVFPIRKHNDGDKILFRQLQCLGKAFYVTVVLVKRVMERILVVTKVLIPFRTLVITINCTLIVFCFYHENALICYDYVIDL